MAHVDRRRDHVGLERFAASGQPPVLQEPVHVDVGQQRARYPAYNGAKLPFDLTVTIPRERLRTRYGDGFLGAPLMLCRPSKTRWPDHGGADATAQDNTPDAQGPGEP